MTNNNLVIGYIATTVVAGAVGAFGGITYQKSNNTTPFERGARPGMMQGKSNTSNGQVPAMQRGGMIVGEVTAKDEKSITVKMADGGSKIIVLSDATTYRTGTEAKVDDLAVGKTVSIMGIPNSDGSTTATNIELNPMARQLGGK